MVTYKTLPEVYSALGKQIKKALSREVAQCVIQTEREHIEGDVYEQYSPKRYKRRKTKGGLIAKGNIHKRLIKSNTLEVTNATPYNPFKERVYPSDRSLAQLIEEGYTMPNGEAMPARPFTSKTVTELEQSGAHVNALKDALRAQGVDVLRPR